jgi:hypothetical protein
MKSTDLLCYCRFSFRFGFGDKRLGSVVEQRGDLSFGRTIAYRRAAHRPQLLIASECKAAIAVRRFQTLILFR